MTISLKKGQKIDLTKKSSGRILNNVCVGLNWGAIETHVFEKEGSFFGFGGTPVKRKELIEVDLDASCILLDSDNNLLDTVYYGQLQSKLGGVFHSGDDLTGDMDGDDGLDNEIITVNFDKIPAKVEQIVFFLNSYKKQDFADIPFATIRIYEGTAERIDNIHANFDVANGIEFAGKISMIMGKFYRRKGEWKFSAIGEPTTDRDLKDTIKTILSKYA